jgi:hypothetical protein
MKEKCKIRGSYFSQESQLLESDRTSYTLHDFEIKFIVRDFQL